MLTKHKYQNLPHNWDEGRISDCCTSGSPDDPTCGDCCYDSWQEELKQVTKKYDQVNEDSQQLSARLGFLIDRRNRYKTWKDELAKGEELARAICYQLEIIAGQSQKIWYNSCKAAEAIRILFCMIRDFYFQVDYLKKRFDELQNCINHNHDSSLVKGKGILKCLEEYGTKLEGVIKTRDLLMAAILDAIRLSELIRNAISTQGCPRSDEFDPCNPGKPCECKACEDDSEKPTYGFRTIICEWYCAFGCNEECKPCDDNCEEEEPQEQPQQYRQSSQQQQKGNGDKKKQEPSSSDDPCKCEKCELEPQFSFPICNDNYKCLVDQWYEEDDSCVKKLEAEFRDKTKEKEALLACKSSLQKAITEVDPKARCS